MLLISKDDLKVTKFGEDQLTVFERFSKTVMGHLPPPANRVNLPMVRPFRLKYWPIGEEGGGGGGGGALNHCLSDILLIVNL